MVVISDHRGDTRIPNVLAYGPKRIIRCEFTCCSPSLFPFLGELPDVKFREKTP